MQTVISLDDRRRDRFATFDITFADGSTHEASLTVHGLTPGPGEPDADFIRRIVIKSQLWIDGVAIAPRLSHMSDGEVIAIAWAIANTYREPKGDQHGH